MNRSALTIMVVVAGLLSPAHSIYARSPASTKKKTVGDVLRNIEKKTTSVQINKGSSQLPEFKRFSVSQPTNLSAVKPPASSSLYYDEGTDEAALAKVTDEGIDQLYKLTQKFSNSSKRGELWLRLAELYVEKARLIEYKIQNDYDAKLAEVRQGKTKVKPKLNLAPAQAYNKKAIQLYEWFLRDFPKDPKVDQALFFLGYNYFEVGDVNKGTGYYSRLVKEHPKSSFIEESNFALGEFHFENERWKEALGHYDKVAANPRARLYSFAYFKKAWCEYKSGQTQLALKSLERVIYVGRKSKGTQDRSSGGVSRIRLATEALRDLVYFYGEVGTPEGARGYFNRVAGSKSTDRMLEKLAYYYVDTGNRAGAKYVFGDLIEKDPMAPKAYDFQYQIVTIYSAAGNDKVFRDELYRWIDQYGPESAWANANRGNAELMAKSEQLIETTLRNYVLQQHQTAQNSKSSFSQKNAQAAYDLYFQSFKKSAKIDEMHFFYGELLYDMKSYERAAFHYLWVVENAPKSPYFERSSLNAVLSLEKKLPSEAEIKKIVGKTNEPVEFDRTITAFVAAAERYFKNYPKGESAIPIKYRVASLHYYYNHYDQAIASFREIIKEAPKSKEAEYSANLILDIFNIKNDFTGLETAAAEILAIPGMANSPVGAQIKNIRQRTSFKQAESLEKGKDYLKSAQAYEDFANKNPGSELAISARFNAAVNYERGKDLTKAIGMYSALATVPGPKNEEVRKKSQRFLVLLYENTGQYAKAAGAFQTYADQNPKDPVAVDFYYNAAIIQHGLKDYNAALNNYQRYFDRSKKRDRVEVIFFMAQIWEARGNNGRAIGYYEEYLKNNPANARAVIEAHFKAGQLSEKMGRITKAKEWYEKTVAVQRRLSRSGTTVGVPHAAEAKFKLVYPTFEELRAIRIPKSPAQQAEAVQKKLAMINRLKDQLKAVIAYDDGHQIVAALALQGQALQHMAASIYSAPMPSGLNAEETKQYQEGIDKLARPFQDQAIETYQAAITKAHELQAYNDWLKAASTELGKLKKDGVVDRGEEVALTQLTDTLGL